MLKLIKLEWKKNKIGRSVRNALLLAFILCLFIFAMNFWGIADDPETGVPDAAFGMEVISSTIELLTSMAFLIFASVMLSSFIVSSYKNKTMQIMFSYPVKRQKILISQMLAVWIFNAAALILTKLLIYGCIQAGSAFMTSSFIIDFDITDAGFYIQLIVKSLVIITMSFISLFIGMAMKSSKAVIVSAFLLAVLTQANIGDLTLRNHAVFPILLTVISLISAVLSTCRVEQRDLM